MIKVGIMSFAHLHAYSYAHCLCSLPDVELTAIWDDDVERGKDAAQKYNTKFVESMDEFLSLPTDGVVITSENVNHKPMVIKAGEAKKWILCEKPLATTIEDAKMMIKTCREEGVGLGIAFPCKFLAPIIRAKEYIESGKLGTILSISCTNNGFYPGGWFGDISLSGGGATMDHTVHVADILRWITGKEFKSVYCELGNQVHKKTLTTDDIGCLQLEMEGGIQVSHIASWSRPKSFPTWGDVTLEFVGTKGVLYVDAFNQKLNVYSDFAMKTEWAFWGDNPDMGLISDFVKSIQERRDPISTGLDGLRSVEVTVFAYESANTGKRVNIKKEKI
ncbi:MAG TPA: Gfo/Idh/MocA family oxidoreductase [Candidatus Hydrogenedens sp.]|nr:Gfo/Idh/MocA family oxidoreductase [Candidatus Hydrogenedens sp.]HOL20010.1 Gfo/Idh/MocA family oxidoreductase [Candidatus Hydrogenedens sp.]HPP59175.1 Gfo/Idh/MocA family oxidoreductase [Candidatus Hydrogenedens sp.]